MPSRYHPIEDGLWDDPKFDANVLCNLPEADGDERGFYAFLCSNKMQRPCGIYRATDAELACAYRWPIARIQATLPVLVARRLIVRDGAWLFTPGYWKRQAHNPGMVKSARSGVESCSSQAILESFIQHYPLHTEWLPNGCQTVAKPISEIAPTEQSRAEQYRAEQSTEDSTDQLDPALKTILSECPHLALVSNGASSGFWDQVLGACEPYPMADSRWLGAKLRVWNTWFESNPSRRSRDRKRLETRLMGWLTRDLERLARSRT